jgi:hypothetical protein
MITVRTCGSGISHKDERLQLLKKMVEYWSLENEIFKLHDHKGTLTVYWFIIPDQNKKDILKTAWVFLGEPEEYVEHIVVTINDKML